MHFITRLVSYVDRIGVEYAVSKFDELLNLLTVNGLLVCGIWVLLQLVHLGVLWADKEMKEQAKEVKILETNRLQLSNIFPRQQRHLTH